PLLERIGEVKGLIQFAADAAEDVFFRVGRLGDGQAALGEQMFGLAGGQGPPEELLQGGQVDGGGGELAAHQALDLVAGRYAVGEARQVFQQRFVAGAEVVRPVVVDEDAVAVARVVTVTGDVAAAIDDEDLPAEDAGGPLGDDASDRPGAADEQIDVVEHG